MKKLVRPGKTSIAATLICCGFLMLAAPARSKDAPAAGLLSVKRVYVEKLSGGDTATQIRDMIIARLQRAKLFLLTEDPERADAFLRGSGEDLIYTDTHDTREGVDARGALSVGAGRSSGGSRRRGGIYVNSGVGQSESSRIVVRKHEATAAVRLVNKAGDVIWSTVQESKGTKFHGASADVADRVAKQLLADYERARRKKNRAKFKPQP